MQLKLNAVRASFLQIFEPGTVNGEGDLAYSASFIMPPDHPAIPTIREAIDVVGRQKWGDKWLAIKKELEMKDRLCLHDGDTKGSLEGYAGNLFLASRSKIRPLVIDRDRTPLTSRDGKPYSGCYVNASVEVWCQDNKHGRRVNAALRGVQFVKDGDPFTGGSAARTDDFETVVEDDLV